MFGFISDAMYMVPNDKCNKGKVRACLCQYFPFHIIFVFDDSFLMREGLPDTD